MSNYNDNPYGQQPPVRHRRSDRYKNQSAPKVDIPAYVRPNQDEEEQREIQWERRSPSNWPEENADGRRESAPYNAQAFGEDQPRMRRQSAPLEELDEDFDDERRVPWVKILLAALAVVLLLCVALHFMKDAGPLNPIKSAVDGLLSSPVKAPGEVLSFQASSSAAATNTRLFFNLTTNKAVDGVRLEDKDGNEIVCTANLVNGDNETNKIWNISAVFEEPYSGDVFAVIREGETWKRTAKSVPLAITDPTPAPTEVPLPTQVPLVTVVPAAEVPVSTEIPVSEENGVNSQEQEPGLSAVVTWAPTNAPLPTEAPTPDPTQVPTQAPTDLPTPDPTEEPTYAPTAGPTLTPTATPLPHLEASPADNSLKSTDTVYQGKKSISFSRENSLIATHPDNYTFYPMGVATFRGDNFRRNAAYGTAEVKKESMSVLWQTAIGSLRTADNGTLYGVGWTGQPAIIKWTTQVREMMNLYPEKKETKALAEVIFGAQDGKVYFLDLRDGSATRDTINVGYPLKGSVSIDSWDRPLLAVGQGISKLSGKTGAIGLHVYNLIDGKEAFFLNGRKSDNQVQYNTNGAFDGTALFLFNNQGTDAMIVAGENGLLYTVDLNGKFIYPNQDNPDATPSMKIDPAVTYLRTKSGNENDAYVGVESSVAMYDRFIYMADGYGVIRCVDSDNMKTVWAIDGEDNIDAAMALDMVGTDLSLYTGNTNYSRLGSKKNVSIRRINALTGEVVWTYEIKCSQDKKNQLAGCKASPVIGQHAIDSLVIFTVNMVEGGGSKVIALNKSSGQVVWEHALKDEAISSPVAVYNEQGEAWIIQGDEGGNLTMLNGKTGAVRSTLNLGGSIQGSPAVYKNYLVIGTCSKDNAFMYGIRIE